MKRIFKEQLFHECKRLLEQRIHVSHSAMLAAQDAANNEDKSSAGDKYETSRAMGQLDRDMNAKQLAEAQSELNALLKIRIDAVSDNVIAGSLVNTNNGDYFIAVGLGTLTIDGKKVIVLSPRSPLAKAILGRQLNDSFEFNKKLFHILSIS